VIPTKQPLSLLDRARAYVAKMPGAVQGDSGDCKTLNVANVLIWDFALSENEALPILREFNARCSPPWTESELIRKLHSAERQPHAKPRGNLASNTHPMSNVPRGNPPASINPTAAIERFLKGFRCEEVDLWEASPIRPPDDWTKDALVMLQCLYQPGEKINFVTDFTAKDSKAIPAGRGLTVERDALMLRWLTELMPISQAGGWMRMNPVDGQGVNDANITAFRFALIECDGAPLELQMSLLAKLPLPISAILTSGGRSLHAWVKIDAQNAEDYRNTVAQMLSILAKFGVDGKNKNPSRLSRLPGVVRAIGATGDGRQRLLYLNPTPIQKKIIP